MRRHVSGAIAILSVLVVLQPPLALSQRGHVGGIRSRCWSRQVDIARPAVAQSPRVQAKMYAQAIHGLTGPKISVFNQLCGKADPTRTCVPTTAWLRNALDARVSGFGVTITWVDAAVPDSTDFWVFAPIRSINGSEVPLPLRRDHHHGVCEQRQPGLDVDPRGVAPHRGRVLHRLPLGRLEWTPVVVCPARATPGQRLIACLGATPGVARRVEDLCEQNASEP